MAAVVVVVSLEEVQRKLSEYRLGQLFSHNQQWRNGRGGSADASRRDLAGFISLALRANTAVLWELDRGRSHEFLALHDPSLPDDGAVTLIVSPRNVQFELAGRRCFFGIDSHGCIDPSSISDPHHATERMPVQLAVTVRGAPAGATVQEILEIGRDWGFRFVGVAR
jgi:hypothetical protein